MLKTLLKWEPGFSHFEDTPLISKNGSTAGWHSQIISHDGITLGGGAHEKLNTAKRIAIAEVLERAVIKHLKNSEFSDLYKLKQYPTSSGFAAGFDKNPTLFRAICEAIERWAWSQWIDSHFKITLLDEMPKLSNLGQFYLEGFDRIQFYQQKIKVESSQVGNLELKFGVALGFSKKGIFPGSRVTSHKDDLWTHALLEAWRNKQIFEKLENAHKVPQHFFPKRVLFFGSNSEFALNTLKMSTKEEWPKPKLNFIKQVPIEDNFYIFRALCDDFIPWHEGTEKRFVY